MIEKRFSAREESQGMRCFSLREQGEKIPKYQKTILEKGCGGLLRMRFLETRENSVLYYLDEENIPLSEYVVLFCERNQTKGKNMTQELLRIFYDLITSLLEAEDRLLLSHPLWFELETLFVHTGSGRPGVAYRYREKGQERRSMLADLIRDTVSICDDEQWKSCGPELECEIRGSMKGAGELLTLLEQRGRDTYENGWPEPELLRTPKEEGGDEDRKSAEEKTTCVIKQRSFLCKNKKPG